MALHIEKFENYFLLNLNEDTIPTNMEEWLISNQPEFAELPYLIVNNSHQSLNESQLESFGKLQKFITNNSGLMLFVNFNVEDLEKMENLGLTTISSLDEAVDYIFMDQLEKELGAE